MQPYTAPKYNESAFNCPFCGAFAEQIWYSTYGHTTQGGSLRTDEIVCAKCTHCKQYSVWYEEKMIVPNSGNAPMPNHDLPPDIMADYKEARSIVSASPRGAAALLRLAIQKLCKHLGEDGKDINDDIASLVKKGLNPKIQKALDIVRVIGNNAVHPGQIDLKDDNKTAEQLFGLVNLITEVMITQPNQVDKLYDSLPQEKLDAIEKRDSSST